MAKISNLRAYEQAEKGKRVFSFAAADAQAAKMGFWRRGYKVSMRSNKRGVITLVLQ